MRGFIAGLLLVGSSLIGSIVSADPQTIGGQWSGLNNGFPAVAINDTEAQDLLNVDLCEGAACIRKRTGIDDFRTIGVSTWGVRGGYYYRNSAAADLVIHANGKTVSKSSNAGAYTAFLTTGTNGAYWDFTDSLGYLYGANSSNDEIWRYDGTTLSYFPNHPKGDQIEFTSNRLAISGTTANPKRVTFCKASDPTDCTTSSDVNDAFSEDLDMPGQRVTAINSACGGVLAMTKEATSLIAAQDQYDFSPTEILSNTIGTIQPYSVVDDLGVTYWQGTDKNFYSYDCSVIRKVSSKLDVSNIVSGEVKSWEVSTKEDFESGVGETGGTGLATETSPGDIVYRPEIQNDNGSNLLLTATGTAQSFFSTYSFILSGGYVKDFGLSNQTGTFQIRTNSAGIPSSTVLSTATTVLNGISQLSFSPAVTLTANTTYWIYYSTISASSFRWGLSCSDPFPNGYGYRITDGIISSCDHWFSVFSTSATYQSEAFNIGSAITSYGSFDANNVLNGGAISFAIYAHNASNISPTTFTSSQTITAGSIPAFAVQPYVLWTAVFTRTAYTQTPTLNDVTINWNDGALTRHWGSVDKDHRIIWSVAEGTATAPNVSYIYDPRFDAWLKYSFAMDAVARVGDINYFGGVSTGVVYKWPSGNTDDGSAITAYWKSKDFIAPDPFIEKDYSSYSLIAKTQTGSSLDITYTINTSSTVTNNFSLTDSNGNTIRRINANMPSGRFGTFISWKFGNDDGDAPFEVYAMKYEYKPRSWKVLP